MRTEWMMRITSLLKCAVPLILLPCFLGAVQCEAMDVVRPSRKELLDAIVSAFGDEDPRIRAAAAGASWKCGGMRVRDQLIESLDDKDFKVRLSALNSLGYLRDEAVVPRIGQFMQRRAASGAEMLNAVCALGGIGAASGVQYLESTKSYPDIHLRRCVADSLARIGGKQAIHVLTLMLDDSDTSVGFWAAGNLFLLGVDRGKQHLQDNTEAGAYKDTVDEILSMIDAGPPDELSKPGLSYALQFHQQKRQKSSWVDLEKQMADPDNEFREDVILLYASLRREKAREKLRRLLKDAHDEVRVYAAGALLSIGDAVGVPVLKDALEGNMQIENPSTTIAYLLEFTQTPLKESLLLQMYSGENALARISAASQLYELSTDRNGLQEKKSKL